MASNIPEMIEAHFAVPMLGAVLNPLNTRLDAANIAFNLVKSLGDGLPIGPILLGAAKPVHILTPTATVRRLVNMAALSVVDANAAGHR